MHSTNKTYILILLAGLALVIMDCSVEKNTGASRFYHSLTSRYNIYFNGYESFKAGLAKINTSYSDDFSELLRVFEYSDPSTASMCSSDMDKAIQKASKVISLKSISAKPDLGAKREINETDRRFLEQKEYNKWVDDSYLLIGKARFYRHEFDEAESVFNHCITEANDENIKTEAMIWLARIANETGNYQESNRILKEIEERPALNRSLKAMLYTTISDFYIKQNKYNEAAGSLSEALKFISGKRTRYRLTYLLAQLYEKEGNSSKATDLYSKVIKMNPPYDVEFNALINIAGIFDINSGNPEEIKHELEKMLRDSKNSDFKDQIYYVLGNLSMKEGDESKALEFYSKSAASSTRNQNQKGKSYLAMAEYFYDKPDYVKAGKYYDSAVYFLDQKYPDYNTIKTTSQDLNSLVVQLNIISTEDSLQRIASMSDTERKAFIAAIIDKIVKDESEGKRSEYADRFNIGQYYENERRFQDNIEQEGKWYFYNQAALTFGRSEFRRRWGDRRLEDNWRRSNKARVNVQTASKEGENNQTAKVDTSEAALDYRKPEFYLRNLPLNDSLLKISNNKIINAYFNSGKIYAEKFSNTDKAAESFEAILKRFPDSEFVPEALYNTYLVLRNSQNTRAEIYRQRLISKYPETEFSKIISDPEYYKKRIAETEQVERMYQTAYSYYTNGSYAEAVNVCDSALAKYGKDLLAPKFQLLKAHAVAIIKDEKAFRNELNYLRKNWPDAEESKRASELIAFLDKKTPELKIEEEKTIASDLYIKDTTNLFNFVIIIDDKNFNLNQASFDIISYNIDNYTNKNYRTEGTLVDNKYLMITVSGFTSNTEAWDYYRNFRLEKIIRNPSGTKIYNFLINKTNLDILKNDRNPERYFLFFNENFAGKYDKK